MPAIDTLTLLALTPGLMSSLSPGAAVENVDAGETFATIQEAIDDAGTLDGHTLEMLVAEQHRRRLRRQ